MNVIITRTEKKISVSCGLQKASVYPTRIRGRACWSLKYRDNGQARSNSFTSENAAVSAAEEAVTRHALAAGAIPGLTTRDLIDLLMLKEKMGTSAPAGTAPGTPRISVAAAAEEYRASCVTRGCGPAHISTIKYQMKSFSEAVVKNLADVTVGDVNAFLATKTSPVSKQNYRTALISLGNFAKKRGWLPYTMPTAFEQSDRPVVKKTEHDVYMAADLEKILREMEKSEKQSIPWFVIGAFAGVRAAERGRLDWSDIDLENKVLILGTSKTKTARRRVVDLPENLLAWLAAYRDQPIVPYKNYGPKLYKAIGGAVKRAGVRWVNNGLRASAASYHLLKFENAGKTALQMGHSVKELETVYFKPGLKSEAEKWYSLFPSVKT